MSFVKASNDPGQPAVRFSEDVKVSDNLKKALIKAFREEFGNSELRLNVTSHFAKQDPPWPEIEIELRFKQQPISPEPDKVR